MEDKWLDEAVQAIETVAINAAWMEDAENLKRLKTLLLRVANKIDDKIEDIEG